MQINGSRSSRRQDFNESPELHTSKVTLQSHASRNDLLLRPTTRMKERSVPPVAKKEEMSLQIRLLLVGSKLERVSEQRDPKLEQIWASIIYLSFNFPPFLLLSGIGRRV